MSNVKTMRSGISRVLVALTVACALALALLPARALAQPAAQADIAYSGAAGTCVWSIDMAGQLVIEPASGATGTIGDFGATGAPWMSHARAVKSIVVRPGVKASGSLGGMFINCSFATSVDLSGLDTSAATSLANLFYNCSSLTSVSLAGLDTSNVTNMSSMFNSCTNLETVDLAGINTAKVTNMALMFGGCSSLKSVDVSGFDTAQVTSMAHMFSNCPWLEKLDFSSFDTARVNDMANMFYDCTSLSEVKLGAKFSFLNDRGAPLTTLPAGNWYSLEAGRSFTPEVIADQRKGVVDTYKKEKEPTDEVVMYRLYNPNSGEHFYTADANERTTLTGLGWNDEGEGWRAPSRGDAVYRLYNPVAGEHHYTLDVAERDALVAAGWTDEGTGWYSTPIKKVPLYRAYNPNAYANNHNYTASANEQQTLLSWGWLDEGTGWYGIG